MLDKQGDFPGVAPPSQREVWLSLCPDPNLVLGVPADLFPARGRSRRDLLAARHQRIGPSLSLSYRSPLQIVRGSGQYLYDELGRQYLDLVNNVCHVGHSHPVVVAAAQRQSP